MSDDIKRYLVNTANFTLQKYAAAVAFAVLKVKPENVSIQKFCEELGKLSQNNSLAQDICISQDDHSKQSSQNNNPLQIHLENNSDVFSASQPINQETTQVFNSFKSTFNYTESQQISSKIITEFEALQTLDSIKNIIRNHSNNLHNYDMCKYSSQDSGYISSQNCTEDFKKKQSDLTTLDRSLSILTVFLNNISIKTLNKTIVERVSKEFGEALDVLYRENVYLQFYDNVVDILDNIVKSLKTLQHHEKVEDIENILLKFNLFNESSLLIHHCLAQLTDELQLIMDKLLCGCVSAEAIEAQEPDMVDSLFYILHVFEVLLRKRNRKVLQEPNNTMSTSQALRNTNQRKNITQYDEESINRKAILQEEQLKEKYTKLLSLVILECSESYPLVAFWAMECHNVINLQTK